MKLKQDNKKKKFYTGKSDVVFKAIYCNEDNIYLTNYFLKKLLNEDVNIIGFLNTELNVNHVLSRRKTVDSLICTEDKMIHIELNSNGSASYLNIRNFTFFSEIYNKKTLAGQKYKDHIDFIHFDFSYNLPKSNKNLVRIYTVNDRNGHNYINNFKIIEYNMDRIMKFWYDEDEENIIKYIHLITLSLNLKELNKLLKNYKLLKEDELFVKEFLEKLKELNKEDYFVSSISKEKDLEMIANTERDIGFEQGIEQGIFETAKNFIKLNVPLSKISKATGLSVSELKKLKTTIF